MPVDYRASVYDVYRATLFRQILVVVNIPYHDFVTFLLNLDPYLNKQEQVSDQNVSKLRYGNKEE